MSHSALEEMLSFLDRAEITQEDYKDFVTDDDEDSEDVFADFRDFLDKHPVPDTELETDF